MKNGDWVKVKSTVFGGIERIGYILDDSDAPRYSIMQIHPKVHNLNMAKITAQNYNMIPLDSEGIDMNQINDLIDLALSTKDKKWFDELVKIKQNVV